MKRCSKCHAYLSLDNFSRDRARKDGRRSQCKQCCKAYESSAKGKAAKKRYEQSELGRAAQKRYLLCQRMSATRWLAIGRSNLIYTHQQAREQIPGLVKTLNLLVSKADSDTSIDVTVADGFYEYTNRLHAAGAWTR
jgi:hypothetical protein